MLSPQNYSLTDSRGLAFVSQLPNGQKKWRVIMTKSSLLPKLVGATVCALILSSVFPVTAPGQGRWREVRRSQSRFVVYSYRPRPYVVYPRRSYRSYTYVYQPYYVSRDRYGYYQPYYSNRYYSYRYSQPYFANRYTYSWANPTYVYRTWPRHSRNRITVRLR